MKTKLIPEEAVWAKGNRVSNYMLTDEEFAILKKIAVSDLEWWGDGAPGRWSKSFNSSSLRDDIDRQVHITYRLRPDWEPEVEVGDMRNQLMGESHALLVRFDRLERKHRAAHDAQCEARKMIEARLSKLESALDTAPLSVAIESNKRAVDGLAQRIAKLERRE